MLSSTVVCVAVILLPCPLFLRQRLLALSHPPPLQTGFALEASPPNAQQSFEFCCLFGLEDCFEVSQLGLELEL